jgi:outer membrane protein assembly factor BamD
VEEKRVERFRDTIDEYYSFQNDFPESEYLKEAQSILSHSERIVARKGVILKEDEDEMKKH